MSGFFCPLSQLPIGCSATIWRLAAKGQLRRRLLDLGLVPHTTVRALFCAPAKDPTAYLVRGTAFALRRRDAQCIYIYRNGVPKPRAVADKRKKYHKKRGERLVCSHL